MQVGKRYLVSIGMVAILVKKMTVTVDGAAELIAVGNANPKNVASFQQPHRHTFHGKCLAVLRPLGKSGKIRILAESPGLSPSTVDLEAASS